MYSVVTTTEHTQSGNSHFLAYIPSFLVKSFVSFMVRQKIAFSRQRSEKIRENVNVNVNVSPDILFHIHSEIITVFESPDWYMEWLGTVRLTVGIWLSIQT